MATRAYTHPMSKTLTRKPSAPAPSAAPRRVAHYSSRGSSLGLSGSRAHDLIQAVRKGLPFKALKTFSAHTGFAPSSIASAIDIPERTLARRRTAGRLAPDESERLLRISTIFEKAVVLFEGDVPSAMNWLTTPKRALGHNTPWAYSRFEPGAREVENLIGRLEHGVFT
jgi:putative toxin-antitoxin system antitoxin component (TIGR02293 family)